MNKLIAAVAVGILGLLSSVTFSSGQETNLVLTISSPVDGAEVGESKNITGIAKIPSGHHVWVFIRKESFRGVWWPQDEGRIDPKTGEWNAEAYFGQAKDIGSNFEVAAAIVNEKEHILLQDYREKSMISGDWKPQKMPATLGAPKIIKVKKISHN